MTDANPGGFFVAAYETERLKTLSVWSCFGDADLGFLHHYAEASGKRCEILATKAADWWDGKTRFFDVEESCRARARSHPREAVKLPGAAVLSVAIVKTYA